MALCPFPGGPRCYDVSRVIGDEKAPAPPDPIDLAVDPIRPPGNAA